MISTLMGRAALGIALAGMVAATPSIAASPCKDAKGRFVKCPTTKAANVVKGKDGKCRIAHGKNKGKFTKCP